MISIQYHNINTHKLKITEGFNTRKYDYVLFDVFAKDGFILMEALQAALKTTYFASDYETYFTVFKIPQEISVMVGNKAYSQLAGSRFICSNGNKTREADFLFKMLNPEEPLYCEKDYRRGGDSFPIIETNPFILKLLTCKFDIFINREIIFNRATTSVELFIEKKRRQKRQNRLGLMLAQKWLESQY